MEVLAAGPVRPRRRQVPLETGKHRCEPGCRCHRHVQRRVRITVIVPPAAAAAIAIIVDVGLVGGRAGPPILGGFLGEVDGRLKGEVVELVVVGTVVVEVVLLVMGRRERYMREVPHSRLNH